MKLFFDTETTGKANFKLPIVHPSQPRIVQLGALLTDDKGNTKGELNVLISPDGWEIPEEASAIHGITTEDCQKYGVPIKSALGMFNIWLKLLPEVVAHNSDFDVFLVNAETERLGKQNLFSGLKVYCTMKASTDLVKIPSQFKKGEYKWPQLQEAHQHFFGCKFESAHDAMADVRACKSVYFAIQTDNETQEMAK